jgi:hypothetical protein
MIAGYVHQHVYSATEPELRLTLLVCVCPCARAMVLRRMQVLSLIQVPMARLDKMRYTYTPAAPWLRTIGSRGHDQNA